MRQERCGARRRSVDPTTRVRATRSSTSTAGIRRRSAAGSARANATASAARRRTRRVPRGPGIDARPEGATQPGRQRGPGGAQLVGPLRPEHVPRRVEPIRGEAGGIAAVGDERGDQRGLPRPQPHPIDDGGHAVARIARVTARRGRLRHGAPSASRLPGVPAGPHPIELVVQLHARGDAVLALEDDAAHRRTRGEFFDEREHLGPDRVGVRVVPDPVAHAAPRDVHVRDSFEREPAECRDGIEAEVRAVDEQVRQVEEQEAARSLEQLGEEVGLAELGIRPVEHRGRVLERQRHGQLRHRALHVLAQDAQRLTRPWHRQEVARLAPAARTKATCSLTIGASSRVATRGGIAPAPDPAARRRRATGPPRAGSRARRVGPGR